MKTMGRLTARVRQRDERGDLPGWVMITVMTIMLASGIMTLFSDRVTDFLDQTLNQFM